MPLGEGAALAGRAAVEVYPELGKFQQELAAKLAPITGKMGKFSKGSVAGIAGVTAAAGLAGKALYDIGKTFDDVSDTIRVQTGATGKHLSKLQDDFKKVYASVPSDSKAVADAVGKLNSRLQITGKPLQQLSRQYLNLSRLTGTDLDTNIKNISRAMKDAGVPTGKQAKKMDELYRVSTKSGVGIQDLTSNMVKFGSPLRQLGFNFETSAAMFAKFEAEGVNVQTAMPGLRMALKNFAADGREPAKALKQTFAQLKKMPSDAQAVGKAMEVFGTRAGPDMAAAIREGRFSYGELVKEMKNGKGTIQGASDDTADFAENWEILKHKLSVAIQPAATFVFDKINEALSGIVEHANIAIPALGGLAAALGIAVGAQVALNAAALLNPYVALAAAVVGAGVALVALYKNSKTVRNVVDGVASAVKNGLVTAFNSVKVAIQDAVEWVTNAAHNVAGFVSSLLPVKAAIAIVGLQLKTIGFIASTAFGVLKAVIGPILPILGALADNVKSGIGAAFKTVAIVIKGFGQAFGNVIGIVTSLLRGDFSGAWRNAKELVSGVIKTIVGVVKTQFDLIKTIVKNVGKVLSTALTAPWRTIKGVFSEGVKAVQGFINLIVDAVNEVLPGNPLSHVGGGGGNKLPGSATAPHSKPAGQHAIGGKVTTPTAIVGEEAPRHPEFVLATNPRYRRRNLGLFAQAGAALGVPGFARGGMLPISRASMNHWLGKGTPGHKIGVHLGTPDLGGILPSAGVDIDTSGVHAGLDKGKALKGAEAFKNFIQNLPSVSMLPEWLRGLGSDTLGKVKDWVKGKVPGLYKGGILRFNRTYPKTTLGAGGKTLSPTTTAMIAEYAGLPGITFSQIARGESGYHPGMVSSDGGFGMWQMTPRVWAESLRKKISAIGNYFNPVANAKMAKALIASGAPLSSATWHGDQYVTGWNQHYKGKINAGVPRTKGKGSRKAKRLGIGGLQKRIDQTTAAADKRAEYASRADTIGEAVFGFDQLHWLQAELFELMKLRELLLTALQQLQAQLDALMAGAKAKVKKAMKNAPAAKGGDGGGTFFDKVKAFTDEVPLGNFLKSMGYQIGEHPKFGGVSPVHAKNSYHYAGRALDINHDQGNEKGWLDKLYAPLKQNKHVVQLLWQVQDHFDHLHVAFARGGIWGKGFLPGFKAGGKMGKGKVTPKAKAGKKAQEQIKKQQDAIQSKINDVTDTLTDVQGAFSPMTIGGNYKLGDFGGRILDVQQAIRDFGGDSSIEDTAAPKGLGLEALKSIVALRDLGVKFDASQFAGIFHTGGIVPGPYGRERTAIVKAGEGIFTPDQMAAMGPMTPEVRVFIGNQEITDIVKVEMHQYEREKAIGGLAGSHR